MLNIKSRFLGLINPKGFCSSSSPHLHLTQLSSARQRNMFYFKAVNVGAAAAPTEILYKKIKLKAKTKTNFLTAPPADAVIVTGLS